MRKTRHDAPVGQRRKAIALLSARLADAIDLNLQCKHAHWNVRGPNFIALHELFDKLADEVEGHVDTLAERIAQLGGSPDGRLGAVAKASSLPVYPVEASAGPEHIEALAIALASFGAKVRKDIDSAANMGDADSADIFTEISRAIDQSLWFVEAHEAVEDRGEQ